MVLLLGGSMFGQWNGTSMRDVMEWKAGSRISPEAVGYLGLERCFVIEKISDRIFHRIEGKSYGKGCGIPREQLRYLKVLHYDFCGDVRMGELICNKAIASDLLDIFKNLYEMEDPLESIRLVDDFGADDGQSMSADNTSCFNWRRASNGRLSKHAEGLAIDVNPLYNPFVYQRDGQTKVEPSCAKVYADRSADNPYYISKGDVLWSLFISHGFQWGGSWRSSKDYQHFEKK